jgi:excinuclease ABC subunit B
VRTGSIQAALGETERRRAKQVEHNQRHGITPETVRRQLDDVMRAALAREFVPVPREDQAAEEPLLYLTDREFEREIGKLETQMKALAGKMEFEQAAQIRDRILKARRERLTGEGSPAGN